MNGDIKLATLSDTDATNVTGTELVTNGTFDTDTAWTKGTGWSIGSGLATCDDSQTDFSALTQTLSGLDADTEYVITLDVTVTAGQFLLRFGATTSAGNLATIDSSGSYVFTSKPLATTSGISLLAFASFAGTVDNISVRLAEEDRSVNGNGLQVFGTVTKASVASGSDLVAYSGFSSSNYLVQPYNADLDFGTGDFCITGWLKWDSTSGIRMPFYWGNASNTDSIKIYSNGGDFYFSTRDGSENTDISLSNKVTSGLWVHVVCLRRNGTIGLYWNGELAGTNSGTARDLTIPTSQLWLGNSYQEQSYSYTGSLALWRISATAPTAEQIAKIYEDEKVLFQDGAQATLYGTSDAVTALAYDEDTNLLHVGSSAGRSVFQGLRRVDNTTDAVGSCISAVNNLVAED